MNHPFQDLWNQVTLCLLEAEGMLPSDTCTSELKDFHLYLSHNELELALDELLWFWENCYVEKDYWKKLLESAKLMWLDRQEKYISLKLD